MSARHSFLQRRTMGLIRRISVSGVVFIVSFFLVSSAFAATRTWDAGGANTLWSTAANWSDNTVPTAADSVLFDGTGKTNAIIDSSFGGVISRLQTTAAFTGSIIVRRNLTVNENVFLSGGTLNANTSNFTLTVKGSWVNDGAIFSSGTGTLLLAGTGSSQILKESSIFNNLMMNDGLVGYWKFDEGNGSTAYDSSGYNNNGTLMNGQSSTGWTTTAASTHFDNPYALEFDGVNDYVNITINPIIIGLSAITGCAWHYGDALSEQSILGGGYDAYNGYMEPYNFELWLESTGSYKYGIYNASGSFNEKTSTTTHTLNAWHYVCLALRGSQTAQLYVDGVLDDSFSIGGLRNFNFFEIGKHPRFNGNYFHGLLDDVRIYKRALSASEIAQLAAGNQPNTYAGTYTLGSALDVNGTLTLAAGNLDASSSNYGINVAGNWQNDGGVFTARSGTVTMDGTGSIIFGGESSFATLSLAQDDPSLVGYWRFDEGSGGSGTAVLDSSGNGNNGIFRNIDGTGWTTVIPDAVSFSDPYSYRFDGWDDYVEVGDVGYFDGSNRFTVTAWIYPPVDGLPAVDAYYHTVAAKWYDSVTQTFILRTIAGTSGNYRLSGRRECAPWSILGGTNFQGGQWHHVGFAYDGSALKLFLDGQLDAQVASSCSVVNTNIPFTIGAAFGAGGRNGTVELMTSSIMDEVRIYNHALSTTAFSRLASGYASSSAITLGANLVVSSSLTIDSSSWLDLAARTLTATTASITNLGTITESTGKILHPAILSTPSSFTAGETVTFTVTDSDENIDGSTPDTITLTIDREIITLTETGNATGIFTGSIPSLTHTADTVGDGYISRNDVCAYTVIATVTDIQDASDTSTAWISVTDPVTPCPPPAGGGRGSRSPGHEGSVPLINPSTRSPLPTQPVTISPLYGPINQVPPAPAGIVSPLRDRLAARIEKRITQYPRLRTTLLRMLQRLDRRLTSRQR